MSSSDPTLKPFHGGYASSSGGGNYGFSPQTTAAPPAGGYTYTVGHGIIASDLASIGSITLSMGPKFPLLSWGPMDTGDVNITFHEEEGGVWVKAVLSPAYDLTPRESMNIQLLIAGIIYSSSSNAMKTKPLTFIRKNNLERHFNISLA
jgi:hypothetical protein